MIVRIPNLLTSEELKRIAQLLAEAEFIEGKLTAGWHAKPVKQNEQLPNNQKAKLLDALIQQALQRDRLFQVVARPKFIHSILFSRYREGMSYGRHIDNAFMGGANFFRSDLSFTVFLNNPNCYTGGELTIEQADSEMSYKLEAASALVYPSTTLHRVEPVISGERLVAVGWVQSLIRDRQQREILFDLETVKRSLYARDGKTNEFDLMCKSVANLLRQWADN
ncbi:Fe2+-dependent dioxygenase [Roseofilum casamattae]|uniref:Fe2+-dependent dioxygenase n=1 Tax=Roseofilum casamattae BLCC-M143 TaxID=3022442 RepID=A0ABT7BX09_9CYAN|nr:Fe2+-dependent dioxygenase [Roseofilum casamattae]MDJ1182991.1 Fe2+-dependent dioxygenase [Roseofilum casamattae BLCC-M143]